jgi:hypothetical protein
MTITTDLTRLPEPTNITDVTTREYLNELIRVLTSNIANFEQSLDTFGRTFTRIVTGAFDGGGVVIESASEASVRVPFSGIISTASIICDQVGSLEVDIWKAPFQDYPNSIGDSITGGNNLVITSDDQLLNNTLTGWNLTVNSGDVITFRVVSCSAITNAIIGLEIIPI